MGRLGKGFRFGWFRVDTHSREIYACAAIQLHPHAVVFSVPCTNTLHKGTVHLQTQGPWSM